jgi:hypothetical protein
LPKKKRNLLDRNFSTSGEYNERSNKEPKNKPMIVKAKEFPSSPAGVFKLRAIKKMKTIVTAAKIFLICCDNICGLLLINTAAMEPIRIPSRCFNGTVKSGAYE